MTNKWTRRGGKLKTHIDNTSAGKHSRPLEMPSSKCGGIFAQLIWTP
jgi:hypothetical protein